MTNNQNCLCNLIRFVPEIISTNSYKQYHCIKHRFKIEVNCQLKGKRAKIEKD